MEHGERDPIVVIGRGHSGTRVLAHTLYASGVSIGEQINRAGDAIPAKPMYEACQIIGSRVEWKGGLRWSFARLQQEPIDPDFERLVDAYLQSVFSTKSPQVGWKLPETTLAYPWIARKFPAARYLHLVRDPRDSLLAAHPTDDLSRFNVQCPETDDVLERRVASWKYQFDIVDQTPRPERFATVRYEDLLLDQERTVRRLEDFLGIPLARIVVDSERVGRWRVDGSLLDRVEPLAPIMRRLGYDGVPAQG